MSCCPRPGPANWTARQPPVAVIGQRPGACIRQRPHLGRLIRRAFGESVNALPTGHCPNCGGELKIIATILEQPVIAKVLTRLGLQARAPPRTPDRGQALQAV